MAIYLICSSKKGISVYQLHRMFGITYKSAWFVANRIRFAMPQPPLSERFGRIIKSDETYVGPIVQGKRGQGAEKKTKAFSLIQRDGDSRSFVVGDVNSFNLKEIIMDNFMVTAHVMTDEFRSYQGLESQFAGHSTVNHGKKEYVHGINHTNFAEPVFFLLKEGSSEPFTM